MSKVTISGNALGSGTLIIAAPNTSSDITLNLPTTMGTNNGSSIVTTNAAGNLGLGVTPSAWGSGRAAIQIKGYVSVFSGGQISQYVSNGFFDSVGWKYRADGFATLYNQDDAGTHSWLRAPSGTAGAAISFVQAMTLDASSNLLVGTTSAVGKFTVQQSTDSTAGGVAIVSVDGNGAVISRLNDGGLTFRNGGAERARIDSSGNLLVGTTSRVAVGGVNGANTFSSATSLEWVSVLQNTGASPLGLAIRYATDSNAASNEFIYCAGNATLRMSVRSNGGIANFSANNVNLSDERTKKDIENAGSYLEKICAIPVRTFKYKDQNDELLNLGVIAQEVEAVAPELVDVSGFGETPEDGVPLKAIYQTDLQYALMKAIQELHAIVAAQGAEIATLKGQA